MIPVTKPFLPPKEEFDELINQIWARNWLTNNGPLVNELESKLKTHLNIPYFLFTGNGTVAIQMAIKALDLSGEIITTPFSYVATTSTIVWENCTPVFADIDTERLTIDPNKIEKLITKKTCAILATHVYGIPCHTEELDTIAKKHNLKIIYDAAHAFGTSYKGKSLLNYGDISTLSTHATKIFHSIEGGAVISKTQELNNRLNSLRNFGHAGPENFDGVGINGKNSEFHAAMGIANLQHIEIIMEKRKDQSCYYKLKLNEIVKFLDIPKDTVYNYSYCPILFDSEDMLLATQKVLEKNDIFCRRYFYPTLNNLNYLEKTHETPIADDISKRVICLPLYHDLSIEEQDMVIGIIKNQHN